jgi:N-methylhydantoinase A
MKLDAGAASRVVGELAAKLGLDINETAEGILTLINANMANAVHSRTIQKGIDPRGFALVAFGGAGPLQGADVAAMLDIPEIIVPPYPGITSAMGLLTTDIKYDSVRTEFQVSSIVDIRKLNNNLNEMEVSLARQFDADRIPPADVEFIRTGDLRYVGQGYELRVPLPPGEITPENLPSVWADFHARHAAEYGHAFEASPIEIVNVRVSGIGRMPKLKSLSAPVGGSFDKARIRKSPCLFRVDGKLQSFETTFYQRTLLPVEESLAGPAIVLQKDSTTLIPPRATARVDALGNIIIALGAAK